MSRACIFQGMTRLGIRPPPATWPLSVEQPAAKSPGLSSVITLTSTALRKATISPCVREKSDCTISAQVAMFWKLCESAVITLKDKSDIRTKQEPPTRIHHLDWLRVFATMLLIPFHCLEPFGLNVYYINAANRAYPYEVATNLIHLWHMPTVLFCFRLRIRRSTEVQFPWSILRSAIEASCGTSRLWHANSRAARWLPQ